MIRYLEKLRLATWKLYQPLTRIPTCPDAVISDLFVWRNTDRFKTFFELICLPSIFDDSSPTPVHATIVIFNSVGEQLVEAQIEFGISSRYTISLADLIPAGSGPFGTFSVFHSHTPQCIRLLGSFLSERGYAGYRFNNMILNSYAHGNFDAIARLNDQSLQLLGGLSLRKRNFNLQHDLECYAAYDLAIVNPSPKDLQIKLTVLLSSGKLFYTETITLCPRGTHIFCITPNNENLRAIITSRLIMARPLVFKVFQDQIDVFHA